MTETDLLERTDLKTKEGEEEHFAHYADSTSVTEGYVLGTPVLAICGKIFIPSRNPERLRVCPICKEIMDALFLSSE
jgi:rubrerythrin